MTRDRGNGSDRRYIWRAVQLVWRSSPHLMVGSTLVMVVQGILPVIPIYVVKLIVDAVAAGEGYAAILPLVIALGAAMLLTALLQSVSTYIREAQSHVLSDYVQEVIQQKSIELDLGYYEGPEFFDRLHRAQEEAPFRPAQVVETLTGLVRSGISVVGIAGVLVVSLPWYTVVILGLSAIPPALVRLVASRRMFNWRMGSTAAERNVFYLNWLLTGKPSAKEVRLFGLGEQLKERSRHWRTRLRKERLSLVGRRSLGEFVASGVQALVVAGLLAYFTFQSIGSPQALGNLVLFFQAIQKGQQVLAELLREVAQLYDSNLFLSIVFDFLNLEPTVVTSPAAHPVADDGSGIRVDHVSFAYPKTDRRVLEDVSLSVRPGEVVAIVGDNGAGKTTLIKLLCRFYDPTAGALRMDGRDFRTIDPAALRERMSVIFQDYVDYYTPAYENIWFGDVSEEPDDERVELAARRSRAHDFLSTLPNGYKTVLGRWLEEGAELSGGQWKKVALARTLYRNAPIIVLDEPTAGLDPDSEAQFIDDLRSMAEGKSLLIVSHKIASARRADRIYAMRDGRVIEQGTHDELLDLNGFYAGLYRTQLRQIQSSSHA
jgi:ATP-binding cassette, subfamily B, bacterial